MTDVAAADRRTDAVLIDGATVGTRAFRPEDEPALEELLSALADDLAAIAELDCNPVLVSHGAAPIVDMRVRVRATPAAAPIGSLQGP